MSSVYLPSLSTSLKTGCMIASQRCIFVLLNLLTCARCYNLSTRLFEGGFLIFIDDGSALEHQEYTNVPYSFLLPVQPIYRSNNRLHSQSKLYKVSTCLSYSYTYDFLLLQPLTWVCSVDPFAFGRAGAFLGLPGQLGWMKLF